MHEMLTLQHQGIYGVPVSTNRKDLTRPTLHCNDVRFGNLVFRVIKPFYDKVCVYLIQSVPVIVSQRVSTFFSLTNFDVGVVWLWLAQFHVAIEPVGLELFQFILCLAHDMSHTLCSFYVRGAVRYDTILCRHEECHLSSDVRIVIHLLERRSGKS